MPPQLNRIGFSCSPHRLAERKTGPNKHVNRLTSYTWLSRWRENALRCRQARTRPPSNAPAGAAACGAAAIAPCTQPPLLRHAASAAAVASAPLLLPPHCSAGGLCGGQARATTSPARSARRKRRCTGSWPCSPQAQTHSESRSSKHEQHSPKAPMRLPGLASGVVPVGPLLMFAAPCPA